MNDYEQAVQRIVENFKSSAIVQLEHTDTPSISQVGQEVEVKSQSQAQETHQASATTKGFPDPSSENEAPMLPSLESVEPRLLEPSGGWKPRERQHSPTAGRSQAASPPRPRDPQRDKRIGDRGEALVYAMEVERVRRLGYPVERVVWTANHYPQADHDILSVDDDGQDLWIEVKSTMGRDGRFEWSQAEFELALRVRERYVLYRVYEADTQTPSVKPFRDPIALYLTNDIAIDVAHVGLACKRLEPKHMRRTT